jgi:dCTP deaminase
MAVLSDKTIKQMIASGQLIPDGGAENAKYCSYEFTASTILRGASDHSELIETSGTAIEPAQLVWIRAREEISIPANMVGLWIQTQTLSRKGLLLLNISLIEPGYKGPLSAVLVNFGKNRVVITPSTKIAKVVFLSLDTAATNAVGSWDSDEYNTALLDMAANAPKSFLQLQSFEEKADAILDRMQKQMERDVKNLSNAVEEQLEKDLQKGMKWTLAKWGGGVLIGLLFGCGLIWLMMTSYLPRLSEYSKFDELARKAAIAQQAETITVLNTQLQTQEAEIESLKKRFNDLQTNTNSPESQAGTSDMDALPDENDGDRNQ